MENNYKGIFQNFKNTSLFLVLFVLPIIMVVKSSFTCNETLYQTFLQNEESTLYKVQVTETGVNFLSQINLTDVYNNILPTNSEDLSLPRYTIEITKTFLLLKL